MCSLGARPSASEGLVPRLVDVLSHTHMYDVRSSFLPAHTALSKVSTCLGAGIDSVGSFHSGAYVGLGGECVGRGRRTASARTDV